MTEPLTPPAHREHRVQAEAGMVLQVREFGPADGSVVVYHHGTPSCSLDVPGGWKGVPDGVRVLTFDRPGYADSPNRPGRSVADAGRWTEAIADALGVGRFAVMGTSGGGPHAAATAAVLGDRITRLCVSVGIGPIGLPGFVWEEGMPAETIAEARCAIRGENELRAFIDSLMRQDDPLSEWMSQLPPSDQELLSRPDVQPEEAVVTAGSLAAGTDGWVEDDLAIFHRGWGVDLAAVTAQTLLLYGGADVLVPHAHGDAMLRAIGHGQLVKIPQAGHWMRDVEPDVLRWLVDGPDGQSFSPTGS